VPLTGSLYTALQLFLGGNHLSNQIHALVKKNIVNFVLSPGRYMLSLIGLLGFRQKFVTRTTLLVTLIFLYIFDVQQPSTSE